MGIPSEHCDKIIENESVLRQSLTVSTENGVAQDASVVYTIHQNMQAPRYSGSLGTSYPDHGYDHQLASAGQTNAYAYHSASAYSQQYNGPNGQVSHSMSYPTNDDYTGGQSHYSASQDVYGQSMYNNHLHSTPGSWDDPMLLYNHSPRHVMGSSPPATPSPMMRSPPPSGGPAMVMPHYSRHIMMEPSATAAHHHPPAWAHSQQGMSPGMVNSPRATPSPGMGTLSGIVSSAACSPGQGKPFSSASYASHPPPAHQQPISYDYPSGPNPSHSRSNVTAVRPLAGHTLTNNSSNSSTTSSAPSSDPLQSLQKMVMLEPQNMSNSRPTSVSPGGGQTASKTTGSKFSSVEQLAGCGSPSPSPSYASQKSKTPEASSPSVISGDSVGKSSVTGMSPPYSPAPSMHTNTSSETKHSGTNSKVSSGEVCKTCPPIKSNEINQVAKSENGADGESEIKDGIERDAGNSVSSELNSVDKNCVNSQENGHVSKEEDERDTDSNCGKLGLKEESVGSCPVSVINGPGRVNVGAFREYKERHGSRKFPSHAWDNPNARVNRRKKWKEEYERPPQMYPNYPMNVEMNGMGPTYTLRTEMNSLMNKMDNSTERLDTKGYCDKTYYVDRTYGDTRYTGYNSDQPVSLTNYNRYSNYGRNDMSNYGGAESHVQHPDNSVVTPQNRLLDVPSRVNNGKPGDMSSGGVIVSGGGPTMENFGAIPRASTSSETCDMNNVSGAIDNSMSGKKKRGRPLGSKNKPKPPGFEKQPRKRKQKNPKGDACVNVNISNCSSFSGMGDCNVSNASGETPIMIVESGATGIGTPVALNSGDGGDVIGGSDCVSGNSGGVAVNMVNEKQDSCVKKQKIVVTIPSQPGPVATFTEHSTTSVPAKKSVGDYKHRGPYIRVSGSGKREVTVVNAMNRDDEVETKNKSNRKRLYEDARVNKKTSVGFNSTLSANYDVFTQDKSWMCVFCHKGSHYKGLGDLYGPYYIEAPTRIDSSCEDEIDASSSVADCETEKVGSSDTAANRQARIKRKKSETLEEATKTATPKKQPKQERNRSPGCLISSPTTPTKSKGSNAAANASNINPMVEVWVHEDCIIWCHGVYLNGNKIVGLREAMKMTSNTCSECKESGATLGCLQKGCSEQYHYYCAMEKGCELSYDHFCMLCLKHKRQP